MEYKTNSNIRNNHGNVKGEYYFTPGFLPAYDDRDCYQTYLACQPMYNFYQIQIKFHTCFDTVDFLPKVTTTSIQNVTLFILTKNNKNTRQETILSRLINSDVYHICKTKSCTIRVNRYSGVFRVFVINYMTSILIFQQLHISIKP